MSVKQQITINK